MSEQTQIETSFQIAKERYAELGVNVEERLKTLSQISISLHCWQGDDVTGFENAGQDLTGGIQVTGNYPGKARNGDELRADLDIVYGLIPGKHRLNLHAIYAETGDKSVERNALTPADFSNWIEWAKEKGLGLDFNPTFFSHPKADDGFTLSSADTGIRQYWIEHAQACREIGAAMGNDLGTPCVTNVWIPDGSKDIPADRIGPRERLKASLDQVFSKSYDKKCLLDAVECKLFGIGSESYVVGSHEFYMGYAQKNNILLCLDSGHFHPTEVISDKISAVTQWVDELLLHVSRGVRWDSDHVVTLSDELTAIAQEIIRGNLLSRVHIGLDYFDASINRLAAWIIGTRNMIKALLMALLEPTDTLKALELEGNNTARLVLMEGLKTMPFSTVWDYYCQTSHVPLDLDWYDSIISYEKNVLSART